MADERHASARKLAEILREFADEIESERYQASAVINQGLLWEPDGRPATEEYVTVFVTGNRQLDSP